MADNEIKVENTQFMGGTKNTDGLIPFAKGKSGNPKGRPKGMKNFDTVFMNALHKLAEKNNKEAEDIFLEIVANGLKMAREGDFRYYSDLMSRLFGKPLQPMDMTSKGEKLNEPLEWVIKDYRDEVRP